MCAPSSRNWHLANQTRDASSATGVPVQTLRYGATVAKATLMGAALGATVAAAALPFPIKSNYVAVAILSGMTTAEVVDCEQEAAETSAGHTVNFACIKPYVFLVGTLAGATAGFVVGNLYYFTACRIG